MAPIETPAYPPFAERVASEGLGNLLRTVNDPGTLQINITKKCNLACKHCHVGSGPNRTEDMSKETLQACLDVFEAGSFVNLDITGGAPELNPHYRWLIDAASHSVAKKQARGLATRVITRTNAAILADPSFGDLPALWAKNHIEVAASFPHYEARKTEKMRGDGVFEQILAGLKALNAVGYGRSQSMNGLEMPALSNSPETSLSAREATVSAVESPDANTPKANASHSTSALILNIVVNPGGAILPGPQLSIEREFKKALSERYAITFDNLLVITNNPVGRFSTFLESRALMDSYMTKLSDAFNPATVEGAMCRDQISFDVDGRIFDCDFNQIVDLPILEGCADTNYACAEEAGLTMQALTVFDLQKKGLADAHPRFIRVADHCYACTAGAGSSCGGSTAG